MAEFEATVTAAQTGETLADVYPSRPLAAKRPPKRPVRAGRGAAPPPPVARRGGAAGAVVPTLRKPRAAARPVAPTPPAAGGLTPKERAGLIENLTSMLQGLYAHLPLKRAMYAADPVQRLRLLAQRAGTMDEQAFHWEVGRIFTGLRDAHTRYVGPTARAGEVATLPFMVESYGALPEARYVVSNVATTASLIGDPHFVPGVELLWWNAVPIDRAVDLYAELETGGRPDSRRARALDTLTVRALQYEPPPDERWVVVGYRDLKGAEREVRIPWRVVRPGRARTAGSKSPGHAHAIDPAREDARRVKKMLFAPRQWFADQHGPSPARSGERARPTAAGDWFDTTFQDAVGARLVDTASGKFGYLRLWSFDVDDDQPYVDEVIRLLRLMEAQGEQGLIIDLRANPGGLIWAAERLLQLFTPNPIQPTRFSLLATPLTMAMANARQNSQDLEPWQASLDDAVATGEPYSQAVPITMPEHCNDIGQVYGGAVVAVVDPNTYSAGDLFAAGFYDNALGILVTVGEATGAGGANVWWSSQVRDALAGTGFAQGSLPGGVDYTLAVRRATRGSGDAIGMAIEDVGIRGHRTYAMTARDLTDSNQDLLDFCGELLAAQPSTRLTVTPPEHGAATLQVTTRGLDRLDLYVDDRPQGWQDAADGGTTFDLPQGWGALEVRGFSGGALRQRRRVSA